MPSTLRKPQKGVSTALESIIRFTWRESQCHLHSLKCADFRLNHHLSLVPWIRTRGGGRHFRYSTCQLFSKLTTFSRLSMPSKLAAFLASIVKALKETNRRSCPKKCMFNSYLYKSRANPCILNRVRIRFTNEFIWFAFIV